MSALTRGEALRRIVARTDLEDFTDRVLDSFWDLPEYRQLRPARDDARAWVRWNLDLVIRWLTDGQPPSDAELETLRERARERAEAGLPEDVVPANFRRGARFAWGALLEAATDEERPALLESAELLFEFVDRVSRVFSDVYGMPAGPGPISAEETAARAALGRIARDQPPLPEDHLLAERIGFELDRLARPFVVAAPEHSARHHVELAAQLRRRGALAASEGRRVVGLANARTPWQGLELGEGAVVAQAHAALRGERGWMLDQLRDLIEVALARGRSGRVDADEYLAERLLHRSPRLAKQLRTNVYGPLEDAHPELAHTLDLLVEHSFKPAATAAALPVHRNTLRDRVARISELTGVDLESIEGRGLAWLAWLQRRESGNHSAR